MINYIKNLIFGKVSWGDIHPNGFMCEFYLVYMPHGRILNLTFDSINGEEGRLFVKSRSKYNKENDIDCEDRGMKTGSSIVLALIGLSKAKSFRAKIMDGWRSRISGCQQGLYFNNSYVIGSRSDCRELSDQLSALVNLVIKTYAQQDDASGRTAPGAH